MPLVMKGNPGIMKSMEHMYPASCTEREGEVFSYLVTTEDNIQTISEHMHVSRRTLERYISAIYEKTGVKSRVGLINLFNKCV